MRGAVWRDARTGGECFLEPEGEAETAGIRTPRTLRTLFFRPDRGLYPGKTPPERISPGRNASLHPDSPNDPDSVFPPARPWRPCATPSMERSMNATLVAFLAASVVEEGDQG